MRTALDHWRARTTIRPRMALFKYLEPVWAERMMKLGSVRIGTLYDYRRIESHGKERGDKEEGVRVSLTDGKAGFIGGERLPWFVRESLPPVDRITFRFAEGAFLEVHQTAPDAYVYCTCSKFDTAIMERFGARASRSSTLASSSQRSRVRSTVGLPEAFAGFRACALRHVSM